MLYAYSKKYNYIIGWSGKTMLRILKYIMKLIYHQTYPQ